MGNAKNIYDQITDESYIKTHMVGQSAEDTWLDCKQKKDASRGKADNDDIANFAKALSGFANTSGGVLIFGIDARDTGGIDVIQGLKPITGLTIFESDLREAESRVVQRAISGLEYSKIYTDESKDIGIIKVYVPEGNSPPYRSMKDKSFYIRAGDSFVPIDVPQIESLVLKNIKPDLDLNIYIGRDNQINQGGTNNIYVHFQATNIGKSIGKHVLFQLRFGGDMVQLFRVNNSINVDYTASVDPLSEDVVFNWHLGNVIHPNDSIRLPQFNMIYDMSNGPLRAIPLLFEVLIYAENMTEKKYFINPDPRNFWFAIRGSGHIPLINRGGNFVLQ